MTINYSIGSRIRQLRTENNFSQLQLALSAEITPAYLILIERDEKIQQRTVFLKFATH